MKVEVGYNIYLPPGFTNSEARYPVIYYLHGFDGHESSYLEYGELLDAAIRRKQVPAMALVFVNGGSQSYFCDAADGSVMGETVVRELVAEVDRTWRTVASREGRSVHGFSMGGFGALKMAFKYPDLFGSVVAQGAVLPTAAEVAKKQPKVFAAVFGGSAEKFSENDPLALVRGNAEKIRGRVAIRIDLGVKDELVPLNRRLDALLGELKIPHEYFELPGVTHAKDSIYGAAATAGFAFSAKGFGEKR